MQRASHASGETAPQDLAVTSIEALKRKESVCPGEACWSTKTVEPPELQRLPQAAICSALKTLWTCRQMAGEVDRCGDCVARASPGFPSSALSACAGGQGSLASLPSLTSFVLKY